MEKSDDENANFLQEWREFRKLTQAQLAEAIGTTDSVISLLESGARKLSPKWLRKLAQPLRTTPGYLLDYDPNSLPTDVLDTWNAIPDDMKPQALKVLSSFRTGTNG